MDRFELLELIYNMRKANLDLTARLEAAEKKIVEVKEEADRRVEEVRAEYVQRIDDLRINGAARDLQKRMNEIEEQLIRFQRLSSGASLPVNQDVTATRQDWVGAFAPPAHETVPGPEASQNAFAASDDDTWREDSGTLFIPGSEAGESRE